MTSEWKYLYANSCISAEMFWEENLKWIVSVCISARYRCIAYTPVFRDSTEKKEEYVFVTRWLKESQKMSYFCVYCCSNLLMLNHLEVNLGAYTLTATIISSGVLIEDSSGRCQKNTEVTFCTSVKIQKQNIRFFFCCCCFFEKSVADSAARTSHLN